MRITHYHHGYRSFTAGHGAGGNGSAGCTKVRLDLAADYPSLQLLEPPLERLLKQAEQVRDREIVAYQIRLAVHEACANIIDHAYGRDGQMDTQPSGKRIQVEMALCQDPLRVKIDLYDNGAAAELPSTRLPEARDLPTGGFGLYLIHKLMDEVSYEPSPEKNHWRLEKLLIPE